MADQQDTGEKLASMLYSSRATAPFGQPELSSLVSGAVERNRATRVTGALIYEDGKFLQWLEGPADSVNRLFDTISRDPRHAEIEVLSMGAADSRVFADWNLRLFRDRHSIPDTLHITEPCESCSAAHCATRSVALDLARGDGESFHEALASAKGRFDVQVCYCERLIDRFAELWIDDACSQAEVTIGKALALSAMRRTAAANSTMLLPNCRERILVTSAPGEQHHLRAALATMMLSSAGYPTVYCPPETMEELVETLYKTRYAGLVLVTGENRITAAQKQLLHEICRLARFWSRPPLKVALYGRLLSGQDGQTDLAGANHVCVSARHLPDFFDRDVRHVH